MIHRVPVLDAYDVVADFAIVPSEAFESIRNFADLVVVDLVDDCILMELLEVDRFLGASLPNEADVLVDVIVIDVGIRQNENTTGLQNEVFEVSLEQILIH